MCVPIWTRLWLLTIKYIFRSAFHLSEKDWMHIYELCHTTQGKALAHHTRPSGGAKQRLSYWGGVSIVAVVVSSQARASVKLIARHMVVTHTGWFMAAIKLTWIQLLPSISPGIRPLNVFAVSAPHHRYIYTSLRWKSLAVETCGLCGLI